MVESIQDYLRELKQALSGADPAVVQDAMADAEEHLTMALDHARKGAPGLAEPDALPRIIEEYGTPAEVAAAYKDNEARFVPPLSPLAHSHPRSAAARFFGVVVDPRAYACLFYMFFSLITGIIYFTVATTGLSLSAGLIILIIGLPFFALFLLSVQGIALVEGRIVEALLGIRMPRRPLFAKKQQRMWERFKTLFKDKLSWTTILYMLLQLPFGILYFTVFVSLICLGLALIAQPILQGLFGFPVADVHGIAYYLPNWLAPLPLIVGVLWLLLTMHLAKLVGRLHGVYAKSLLVRE
jgi:hypothetical protein